MTRIEWLDGGIHVVCTERYNFTVVCYWNARCYVYQPNDTVYDNGICEWQWTGHLPGIQGINDTHVDVCLHQHQHNNTNRSHTASALFITFSSKYPGYNIPVIITLAFIPHDLIVLVPFVLDMQFDNTVCFLRDVIWFDWTVFHIDCAHSFTATHFIYSGNKQ